MSSVEDTRRRQAQRSRDIRVLTLVEGQGVVIDGDIELGLLKVDRGKVGIAIQAPRSTQLSRTEYDAGEPR